MATSRLQRTRRELAAFLRACREAITPEQVGLADSGRRRTPGLRREEVATLAGVGVTWYTWLEQGRDIGVSAPVLERIARVLKLDGAQRRHLFLLAQNRPPVEPGKTWCSVPPLVRRLMDDWPHHPAYVLNLRWDVLAWNAAAQTLFDFEQRPAGQRNLLWLLFTAEDLRGVFVNWAEQAPRMLASFRRDFVRATTDPSITDLVRQLERASPEFRQWWPCQDVAAPCTGSRELLCDGQARRYQHTTLIVDEDRHLRLVVYARNEHS